MAFFHSKKALMMASALLLASTELLAHSMWLEKTGYGYDFSYGEIDDIDLYDPSRVEGITGYSSSKKATILTIHRHLLKGEKGVARVFTEQKLSMLTGELDNKYWFNTKDGWKNTASAKDNDGIENIVEQGKSYKLTKHIIKWEDYMNQPIGATAEVVPLQNPTKLKEGDFLEVQFYFNGKVMPFKEARVAMDSDPYKHQDLTYLTSSDPVKIKISKAGPQIINAKYKLQLDNNEVIWYSFTLTFNTIK